MRAVLHTISVLVRITFSHTDVTKTTYSNFMSTFQKSSLNIGATYLLSSVSVRLLALLFCRQLKKNSDFQNVIEFKKFRTF